MGFVRIVLALDVGGNGKLMTVTELDVLMHEPNIDHDAHHRITDEERLCHLWKLIPKSLRPQTNYIDYNKIRVRKF